MDERVDENGPDVVGPMEDLRVGKAQGPQAMPRVSLVPAEVHRLLGGGAVVAKAVGLDHEAQLGPEEVDPVTAEPALGVGRRQARLADDREEPPLSNCRRVTTPCCCPVICHAPRAHG